MARAAELRLGWPRLFNQSREIRLEIEQPDTNLIYEVQTSFQLGPTSNWTTAQLGFPGQTNFVLRLAPLPSPVFFRLRLPLLRAPSSLTTLEDTAVSLETVRLQGALPPGTELRLVVTNGILVANPFEVPDVEATGAGTAQLSLRGPIDALRAVYYQPGTNVFGRDTLQVSLTRPFFVGAADESATVEILILPVNDAPEATPDHYVCPSDTELFVAAPGLLTNDADVEGEPLKAALVAGPTHGALSLHPDGSFYYLPEPGYEGSEHFSYRARDSSGAASAAVDVTINVSAASGAPGVRITSPAPGTSVAQGRTVLLRAEPFPPDSVAVRVDYFDDQARIATATAPSFEAAWTPTALGTHPLSAHAVGIDGAETISPSLEITVDPDCDGDGISDPEELIRGGDPCDFFDGAAPRLLFVDGNFQSGAPATILPRPLRLRVVNLDGSPHTNHPVTFTVAESDPALAATEAGPWSLRVTAATDDAGLASVSVRLPSAAGSLGVIQATVTNGWQRAHQSAVVSALGPQEAWVYRDTVVAVAAGNEHSLALLSDGTVRAWGRNEFGQLGDGIDPARVPFTATPLEVPGLSNIVAVAAGAWHSLALQADGSVLAWGEYHEHRKPTPPADLSNAMAIAGGAGHSLALLADGTVRAWGDPFTQFVPPAGLREVVAISAGLGFSVALRADGTVVAWGLSPFDIDLGQTRVPASLRDVTAIAAGDAHALALRADGTVVGWGANQFGQALAPADLGAAIAIAAGEGYSEALLADGTVRRWGKGSGLAFPPAEALALSTAGSGAESYTLALSADGTVGSWGGNSYGQLGDGLLAASPVPVRVLGLPPDLTLTNPVPFSLHTP